MSGDEEKKSAINSKLEVLLRTIYDTHREVVLNKDFSFLYGSEVFVVEGVNVGLLYKNVVMTSNDRVVKAVVGELLYLFYNIMNDNDKNTVNEKYKKPKKPKKPKKSESVIDMENVYKKNADVLNAAEGDTSKFGDVVESLMTNNHHDIAKAAKKVFKNLGLDLGGGGRGRKR